VEAAAMEFTQMIRKSLETRNWLAVKEPRRPSKLWEQIRDDLNCLDVEVFQLYSKESSAQLLVNDDSRSIVSYGKCLCMHEQDYESVCVHSIRL
jgi:hypothetical protein